MLDDEEARREARREAEEEWAALHPGCRRATDAEVAELRRELDVRFGFEPGEPPPYTVNWARDRLKGAAGD